MPAQARDLHVQLDRCVALQGRTLLTHEILAVRCGKVEAIDWYLLDILQRKGVLSLQQLYRDIGQGRFDHLLLARRRTSLTEQRINRLARLGAYRLVHADAEVTHWQRH